MVDKILVANSVALPIGADVSDELDVQWLLSETIEAFGCVNLVVQTAAAAHAWSPSTRRVLCATVVQLCAFPAPRRCQQTWRTAPTLSRCSSTASAMSDLPIAEYALLSDCHSAALVSRSGSLDWLRAPRSHSASLFWHRAISCIRN